MFSHRPFALALAMLLLAFGLVAGLSCSEMPMVAVVVILAALGIVGAALLCVSVVFLLRKKTIHAQKMRFLALLLCVVLSLLGLLRSATSLLAYREARLYAGQTAVATMTIHAAEVSSSGYARYRVHLEALVLDGETVTVDFTAALVQDLPGEYHYGSDGCGRCN